MNARTERCVDCRRGAAQGAVAWSVVFKAVLCLRCYLRRVRERKS